MSWRTGCRLVIGAVMGLPWQDDDWLEHVLGLVMTRLELIQRQADSGSDQDFVARGLAASERADRDSAAVRARAPVRLGRRHDQQALGRRTQHLRRRLRRVGHPRQCQDHVRRRRQEHCLRDLERPLPLARTSEPPGRLRLSGSKSVERFVEESLRLFGPVVFRPRIALQDVELAGVRVKKGDLAIALNLSANRDPRKYDCPAEVDLSRPAPRDHLSFYAGPRSCTGQALARAELEEVTTMVLAQLRGLRSDPDEEAPSYRELLMRRWEPLHVCFTPRP